MKTINTNPAIEGRSILRIAGPHEDNTFYIHNDNGDVWDGEDMRGFGAPMRFDKFNMALSATSTIRQSLIQP